MGKLGLYNAKISADQVAVWLAILVATSTRVNGQVLRTSNGAIGLDDYTSDTWITQLQEENKRLRCEIW